MGGVVGVESFVHEFASRFWVVISNGAECLVAGLADGVAGEDCVSECLVRFGVVDPVVGAPCPGLTAVRLASAALGGGVQGRASVPRADAHG